MAETLVILNPNANSRRAPRVWDVVRPALASTFGAFDAVTTHQPADVLPVLQEAQRAGVRRVIGVGGDGTNASIVDGLLTLCQQYPGAPRMVYGTVPVGTGCDWARSINMPHKPELAAIWMRQRPPRPVDAVRLTLDNTHTRHYLNIASTGLGGEVDRRVNAQRHRHRWSFIEAAVLAVLRYQPQPVTITVDGGVWFEGRAYLVAVANGSTFGHGMQIAPRAVIDDGLLDVVVVRDVPRWHLLAALRRVYDGTHLTHPAVIYRRASEVRVVSGGGALPLDIDGEYASGTLLEFAALSGCLPMLA
jgi:diacylglycerol kinase (ATP)